MVLSKGGRIELSDDKVRLLVVKTGGKLPKVIEAHTCFVEYTEPEQRFDAFVEALRNPWTVAEPSAVYVLCISSSHSLVRTVPIRSAEAQGGLGVQFEIERYLAIRSRN